MRGVGFDDKIYLWLSHVLKPFRIFKHKSIYLIILIKNTGFIAIIIQ